jgi:UDP-N-acetylmuramate: L-alanyl-gamma-D-glutamyl-meso-diaminopimelate ligase
MLKPIRRIHFMGVCGTAMGAVASAIRDLGFIVTGSDENVYPPMSTFLAEKQIPLSSGYRPENVPEEIDLVVIGNAIFRGNPELESVLERKLLYRSLPETIKEFFLQGKHNVVVTGTHGKTTTTALVTWIFSQAGLNPGYFIGGIAKDLQKGASFPDSSHFILEGDEYDTAFFDKRSKFLHYLPETVVINNIEFDHADIFRDLEEIKTSFRRLVNIVPRSGRLFINADDPVGREVTQNALAPVMTVGLSEKAHYRLEEIKYHQTGSNFRIGSDQFEISLVGEFNVRNAGMAAVTALAYGINLTTIKDALRTFQGVARRQEIRGEVNGIKVVDDFGHHPTAIKQTLKALRRRFPSHRLWALFEPRSNTTRRAIFQQQLAEALGLADGVILAEVARIDQVPMQDRLDPWKVVESIRETGKPAFYEPQPDQIVARLKPLAEPGDVIVCFSNGGFGGIHEKLLAELARA